MKENDNLYFKYYEGLYGIYLESRGGASGTIGERNSNYKENLDYLLEYLLEIEAEEIKFYLSAGKNSKNTFTDLHSRLIKIEDQSIFSFHEIRTKNFRVKLNKQIQITGTIDPDKANNSTRSLFITFANSKTKSFIEQIAKVENEAELEYTIQKVKKRLRQSKFRKELLIAYNNKCAVTGSKVAPLLEAAHIEPYNGAHTSVVKNGILLRSDIHDLFDIYVEGKRMINISSDYKIEVHSSLEGSEYWVYNNKEIELPKVKDDYPKFS